MLVSAASKQTYFRFFLIIFPFFYEANFMEESYACLNID